MHLLATWELGRGYGHMGILASVSRAMRALGHRVTFAARYPETAAVTVAQDFDTVLAAPRFAGQAPPGETMTYAQVIAAAGFADAEALAVLTCHWRALIDRVQPDGVLVEHAPVSLLAARLEGLPTWRIGSTFIAPEVRDLGASLLPWRDIARHDLACGAVASDRAIAGVSGGWIDGLADLVAGAPRFATTWPELDHFAGGAPTSSFHGDLGGLGAGGAAPDWPQAPGPKVIVYMPADRGPGPALLEALRQLRWPTVWHWPGTRGSDPDGAIRFSPEPIDLAQAAAEARIFIGRAGHGASAIMLRAGVPQLLVPDTLESLLLAYRLRQAGLATTRPNDATASEYARALIQLASGECADALRRVKRKYAGYDPVHAASRIARLIANTCTILGR